MWIHETKATQCKTRCAHTKTQTSGTTRGTRTAAPNSWHNLFLTFQKLLELIFITDGHLYTNSAVAFLCTPLANKSSAVAEMGDRLATTTDIGRKLGTVPLFIGGGAGSPFNTMLRGPRPTSVPNGIYPAIWPQQTGAKHWGCAPLGELDPHLTQCLGRGLSACQVSSWLIQRFGHNTSTLQTDRQDRTDNLR